VWGYWENFGFLCCFSKKKSLSFIFWTSIGLREYEYYIWELVEGDENINWMNECACKFESLISLGIDFENISCWLYSVITMQGFEPSTLYFVIVHSFNDMYL
jgi:hypothetical protein